MLLNGVVALSFGPYTSGQVGYDVSYPQCPGTSAPSGAFGIVGVNDGRPFTTNPCFGNEYRGVANSAYINTGYARTYRKNVTSGCAAGAPSAAWAIGCSEAETSLNSVGSRSVAMWWIDVETANSWSSGNVSPNRSVIQGAVDRLNRTGVPVGVYSTASMWKTITGTGFTPTNLAGDWVAAGSCSTPFTNSKVWLTQSTSGGVDTDTAC